MHYLFVFTIIRMNLGKSNLSYDQERRRCEHLTHLIPDITHESDKKCVQHNWLYFSFFYDPFILKIPVATRTIHAQESWIICSSIDRNHHNHVIFLHKIWQICFFNFIWTPVSVLIQEKLAFLQRWQAFWIILHLPILTGVSSCHLKIFQEDE